MGHKSPIFILYDYLLQSQPPSQLPPSQFPSLQSPPQFSQLPPQPPSPLIAFTSAAISSAVASWLSRIEPLKLRVLPAQGWWRSTVTLSLPIYTILAKKRSPSAFCNGTIAPSKIFSWSNLPLCENIALSKSKTLSATCSP